MINRILRTKHPCKHCVEVFGAFPGEQWTHTLLERAKPVTNVTGFFVWTSVAEGQEQSHAPAVFGMHILFLATLA